MAVRSSAKAAESSSNLGSCAKKLLSWLILKLEACFFVTDDFMRGKTIISAS